MEATAVEISLACCTAAYLIGVLWFRWGLSRLGGRPVNASDDLPIRQVSVVIAARDEAESIIECLEALSGQTYPAAAYEIIVVDDGSSDDTLQLARGFAYSNDSPRCLVLSTVEETGQFGSKKRALTLGIERSHGEVILTSDADCVIPSGWVGAMSRHFDADTGMVVGYSGIRSAENGLNTLGGWEAVDFLNLMAAAAASVAQGRVTAASGQSLGFLRSAFDEVGGYGSIMHRVSGDDTLLMQLIRRSGNWRFAFCGDREARVVHPPSTSLAGLFAKRARWASNGPYQLQIDPTFFIYLVVTFAVSAQLLAAPLMVMVEKLAWQWAVSAWIAKAIAEGALFTASRRVFDRRDLNKHFLLWVLTQPIYIVTVGLGGVLGRFRWKGRSYRWGTGQPMG